MRCEICRQGEAFREWKEFILCVECYRANLNSKSPYRKEVKIRDGEFNSEPMKINKHLDFIVKQGRKPLFTH